jgi:hypothetical protein
MRLKIILYANQVLKEIRRSPKPIKIQRIQQRYSADTYQGVA